MAKRLDSSRPSGDGDARWADFWQVRQGLKSAWTKAKWGNKGLFARKDAWPYDGGEEAYQRDLDQCETDYTSCNEEYDKPGPAITTLRELRDTCLESIDWLEEIAKWEKTKQSVPGIVEHPHLNRSYRPDEWVRAAWALLHRLPGEDKPGLPADSESLHGAIAAMWAVVGWIEGTDPKNTSDGINWDEYAPAGEVRDGKIIGHRDFKKFIEKHDIRYVHKGQQLHVHLKDFHKAWREAEQDILHGDDSGIAEAVLDGVAERTEGLRRKKRPKK